MDLRYCCCDQKRPLGAGWQQSPLKAGEVIAAFQNRGPWLKTDGTHFRRKPTGVGLLCGPVSGGILMFDIDRERGWELYELYSGSRALPPTVAVQGSRDSVKLLFRVPQEHWETTESFKDLQKGEGHDQGIEVMWTGRQGLVWGSHPTAGNYRFLPGHSFADCEIMEAPSWLIDLSSRQEVEPAQRVSYPAYGDSQVEFALSLLKAIPPSLSDDYSTWVSVGMALHSVSESLLGDWDEWSRGSGKYDGYQALERKWMGFKQSGPRRKTVGYLHYLAIQYGWKPEKRQLSTASTDVNGSADRRKPRQGAGSKGVVNAVDANPADPLVPTLTPLEEAEFGVNLNRVKPTFPYEVLLPNIAEATFTDARISSTDPVNFIQYLLPAVASRMGHCTLDMAGFKVPNVIWTLTVQESGGGKSRADNIVLAPIRRKQSELDEQYNHSSTEYKRALRHYKLSKDPDAEEPQAPKKQKVLFGIATPQAVCRRLGDQEGEAALWARDEFSGLLRSLDQFSSGGEGLDILVETWDGKFTPVDRVHLEDSFSIPESRLSLTGGIQPATFSKVFQDPEDAQGVRARMLIACPEDQERTFTPGQASLPPILEDLFYWLGNSEFRRIRHTPESLELFQRFYAATEQERKGVKQPAIKAWFRKYTGHVLRIALVLHGMECWGYGSQKDMHVLTPDTLQRAIAVGEFYKQTLFAFQASQDTQGIPAIAKRILDYATENGGKISVRDAYRNIRAIQVAAKKEGIQQSAFTESIFRDIERLGLGTTEAKKGGSLFLRVGALTPLTIAQNPSYDRAEPVDNTVDNRRQPLTAPTTSIPKENLLNESRSESKTEIFKPASEGRSAASDEPPMETGMGAYRECKETRRTREVEPNGHDREAKKAEEARTEPGSGYPAPSSLVDFDDPDQWAEL